MTFAYLDFLVQLLAFKYQYNKNKFSIIGLISKKLFYKLQVYTEKLEIGCIFFMFICKICRLKAW